MTLYITVSIAIDYTSIYSQIKTVTLEKFRVARYVIISPSPESDVIAYMDAWAEKSGLLKFKSYKKKKIGWDFPFVTKEQKEKFGLRGYVVAYVIPEEFEKVIVSNGIVKKNMNKTSRVKKLEKKLKREQVRLSRKYECLKKPNKIRKGEATRQNIHKQMRIEYCFQSQNQTLRKGNNLDMGIIVHILSSRLKCNIAKIKKEKIYLF